MMSKKSVVLSLAALAALTTQVSAADDLASAFKEGKTTGTVKAAYFTTRLDDTTATVPTGASAFAIGGKLKFETAPVQGLSAGVEFMTTNDLGRLKSGSSTAQIFGGTANNVHNEIDPTLLMNGGSGSVVGQAYLQYNVSKTLIKVGRQELESPLTGNKETRMLPTTYEALLLVNKDLPSTTLVGAVVTAQKERQSDKFVKMGRAALSNSTTDGTGTLGGLGAPGGLGGTGGQSVGTLNTSALQNAYDSKVFALGAIYSGFAGVTLQAWDYQATDIVNAFYAQADYKTKVGDAEVFAGAQYLKETDIGTMNEVASNLKGIDSSLYGAKVGAGMSGAKVMLAYTQVSDSTATKFGGIIVPWDGTPAFTDTANNNNLPGFSIVDGVGTIYGGSYAAGSKNTKLQLDYDFAGVGIKGLISSVSYAKYDRKFDTSKLGMQGYDVREIDIMAKYSFSGALKGFSLMGMIIPMDVKANDASQVLTGTKSDRTQYRSFITYSF